MTMEAETGTIQLEVNKCQGLGAITTSWDRSVDQILPLSPQDKTNADYRFLAPTL